MEDKEDEVDVLNRHQKVDETNVVNSMRWTWQHKIRFVLK